MKEYHTIETEVRLPYQLAYGATWTRFFEGLKEEKIYGTRCEQCNRVLVPARTFCPRCFVDTTQWVEVSQEGVLRAYVLTNYSYFAQPLKPPFITGLIRLDGTDVNFMHLVGGFKMDSLEAVQAKVQNGMRVKAVWAKNKTGNILDIRHFKPL
ncbi:MAG: Zn-ribbon domain-containing OB-fold protein [Proteobacteria bacterium]|nr:Zn-ribbon domain-containing OB-fold protein [Pseudomonadota bacterium]